MCSARVRSRGAVEFQVHTLSARARVGVPRHGEASEGSCSNPRGMVSPPGGMGVWGERTTGRASLLSSLSWHANETKKSMPLVHSRKTAAIPPAMAFSKYASPVRVLLERERKRDCALVRERMWIKSCALHGTQSVCFAAKRNKQALRCYIPQEETVGPSTSVIQVDAGHVEPVVGQAKIDCLKKQHLAQGWMRLALKYGRARLKCHTDADDSAVVCRHEHGARRIGDLHFRVKKNVGEMRGWKRKV